MLRRNRFRMRMMSFSTRKSSAEESVQLSVFSQRRVRARGDELTTLRKRTPYRKKIEITRFDDVCHRTRYTRVVTKQDFITYKRFASDVHRSPLNSPRPETLPWRSSFKSVDEFRTLLRLLSFSSRENP